MDKIKNVCHPLKNVSLKLSFFIYVAFFIILAVAVGIISIKMIDTSYSTVALYYFNNHEGINRINQDKDEDIQIAVKIIDDDFDDEDTSAILFYARNMYVAVLLGVYLALAIFLASRMYYKRKIGVPLEKLVSAAEKISEKNLDFEIDYSSNDEMGRLCNSFESMRRQLDENNRELWNVIDEQKRVQRAFSHDIRTPLTITMGYVDILREYLPEGKVSQQKLIDTIELISSNLVRLENFVSAMSSMEKLNDIKPKPERMKTTELFEGIQSDAEMICWDKQFIFESDSDSEYLTADSDVIQQMVMNLISNAARYAKTQVNVCCIYKNEMLEILVRDDGNGYSNEALEHADELYYSEALDDDAHFGIGLNICKLLTLKLDGTFEFYNDCGACAKVTLKL